MTTTVLLVRHGESDANAGGSSTDPALIPLTTRGQRQAEAVAAVLDEPDLIVTSGFVRSQQTAAPTIARFAGVAVETWPVHEFTYLGSLHGRVTTGAERLPLVREYWQRGDPWHRDDEQSESFADVSSRARTTLSDLRGEHASRIVIFGHGLFSRVMLFALFNDTTHLHSAMMRRFYRFRQIFAVPNCSIITLTLPAGDGTPQILSADNAAVRQVP